jgi:predicted SnoaL-like aldol condensation-catalyzing enzyme
MAVSLAGTNVQASNEGAAMSERKQQAIDLLKSLETGDPKPIVYINPNKYIQHNLAVGDGMAGLGVLFASLPKGATRVNTVRAFEDGDFVFVHTEYDFFGPKIGFDVFRYEDGKIVEHWDNLQETGAKPSPGGHTMIDGPTKPTDLDKTAANKALMRAYMDDIVFNHRREKFPVYFDGTNYIQHNPWVADQLTGLAVGLQALAREGRAVHYDRVHKILGEGSFVLVISEGTFGEQPTAYYDLYRIEQGKIAEHWDVLEAIPPPSEWKNPNGKFGFGPAM